MNSSITIRKAVREDMHQIVAMIVELATFEGYPNGVELTAEGNYSTKYKYSPVLSVLQRDGFDAERPYFFCYVAECPKTRGIVGYAFGNFAYSSWTARALYLEDFYVKPELRGEKIGHKLFKELCKLARDKECHRIDWHVLVDNNAAIRFYETHGAFDICKAENRTAYRIYDKEILKIANSQD